MSASGSEPALAPLSSPLSSLSPPPNSPTISAPSRPLKRTRQRSLHHPVPSSSAQKTHSASHSINLSINPSATPSPIPPRRKYKPRSKKSSSLVPLSSLPPQPRPQTAVQSELLSTSAPFASDHGPIALAQQFDQSHHMHPDHLSTSLAPQSSSVPSPLPTQLDPLPNSNHSRPNRTHPVSVRLKARAPRYKSLPTTAPRLTFPPHPSPSILTSEPAIAPRLYTDSHGARSLPGHLMSYGPLWEPPAYVHPTYQPGIGWSIKREPIELNAVVRRRMQAAEADLLYGPAMELLCDMGWYKNKWDKVRQCENERWGGWYDHLTLQSDWLSDAILPDHQARDFLPTGISIPPAAKDPASSNPQLIIPSKLENDWAVDSDAGSLNILAGPLKVVGSLNGSQVTSQDEVKFERFAGCNLNRLVPQKPGCVFNAGAPVWSIDFLAGTDFMPAFHLHPPSSSAPPTPPQSDYLAVSTISHDPGLVPPSDIRSRNKDVKSVVQIWRVPFIEPIHFESSAKKKADSGEKVPIRRDEHDFSAYSPADMNVWADSSEQNHSLKLEEDGPSLALLLAVPSQAVCVRWCPRGGSKPMTCQAGHAGPDGSYNSEDLSPGQQDRSLGILAVSLLDGSVGLYAIPHPTQAKDHHIFHSGGSSNRAVTLKLEPIVKLLIPNNTSCLSLDWANHDVLAGGCMDGSIAVWHVRAVLLSLSSQQKTSIRPTHLIPQHAAPIRSLAWIRTPPVDQHGRPALDEDPSFLSSTGYDGSVKVCDLLVQVGHGSVVHERGETTSLHFSSPLGCLHLADSDYSIKALCLRPRDFGVSKKILVQLGLIWQLAGSDFHSFIAYGAADGVCGLASLVRAQKYRSRATMWAPKVYQLDFNRNSGQLRMLDNLVPEPRSQDGTAVITRHFNKVGSGSVDPKSSKWTSKKKKKATISKKTELGSQSTSPIGSYAGAVGVHCVSWNPSMKRGCVLASGTGAGLVRVEPVQGSWNGNRIMRYGSVEGIVLGGLNAVCDDDDDDDNDDEDDEDEDEDGDDGDQNVEE